MSELAENDVIALAAALRCCIPAIAGYQSGSDAEAAEADQAAHRWLVPVVEAIVQARELDWRATAANAWVMGVDEGIAAAARYVYPWDQGKRLGVVIFTRPPNDNPFASKRELSLMEDYGKVVEENLALRNQIQQHKERLETE